VTLSRGDIRRLLESADVRPSKARGQNFVADPNTVRRIARLSGVGPGDRVVEIGAGLGSLTLALAELGASVTAIEIDRRLLPLLRSVVEPAGVTVVEGDALDLDWGALLGDGPGMAGGGVEAPGGSGEAAAKPWTLVANLPYNVATPLVADLLDEVPAIGRMLVMVQREVAERLAAKAGDDAYGAVSVKVAYWAEAKVVGKVPSTVFVPAPSVESALVRITRRPEPAVPSTVDAARLFTLVRAGFGQRRKMLRRSLAGVVDPGVFERAGIRPDARAEELAVEDWGRLAACSLSRPPS